MFNLSTALNFLQAIGPATAAIPVVKDMWEQIVATFDDDTDQQTLQDAYAGLVAERRADHAGFQRDLTDAAKKK